MSSIKHLHIWGCPTEAWSYRPHERKLDSRTISCFFVGYVECSRGYKFYNLTSRSFFETRNDRFIKEVEFGKKENIRNIAFEKEFVIDNDPVLTPIIVQDTTPIIENNVQTIVDDTILEHDKNVVLPQIPIEKPQQRQEVLLKRSIRERRSAIQMIILSFYKKMRMVLV